MCIVKTPSVVPTTPGKEPAIIRNPYLDGLDPAAKSLRVGRSALRIERRAPGDPAKPASGPGGTIVRPPTAPTGPLPPTAPPSASLGISRSMASDFR